MLRKLAQFERKNRLIPAIICLTPGKSGAIAVQASMWNGIPFGGTGHRAKEIRKEFKSRCEATAFCRAFVADLRKDQKPVIIDLTLEDGMCEIGTESFTGG